MEASGRTMESVGHQRTSNNAEARARVNEAIFVKNDWIREVIVGRESRKEDGSSVRSDLMAVRKDRGKQKKGC